MNIICKVRNNWPFVKTKARQQIKQYVKNVEFEKVYRFVKCIGFVACTVRGCVDCRVCRLQEVVSIKGFVTCKGGGVSIKALVADKRVCRRINASIGLQRFAILSI